MVLRTPKYFVIKFLIYLKQNRDDTSRLGTLNPESLNNSSFKVIWENDLCNIGVRGHTSNKTMSFHVKA